jgi:hypothetical protein
VRRRTGSSLPAQGVCSRRTPREWLNHDSECRSANDLRTHSPRTQVCLEGHSGHFRADAVVSLYDEHASRTLARGALQSKTQKVLATPHALIVDHRVWHPCVIGARNVRDCVFVIRADSRSLRFRSHPADDASKRTTESASHDRTRSSRSTTRGMAVRAEPSTTTPITSCTAVGEIATSGSDRRARCSFPISPGWRRDPFHSSSLSCASAHVLRRSGNLASTTTLPRQSTRRLVSTWALFADAGPEASGSGLQATRVLLFDAGLGNLIKSSEAPRLEPGAQKEPPKSRLDSESRGPRSGWLELKVRR